MSEAKEAIVGFFHDVLIGLAKSGAKAAARGVDSVLEDFEDRTEEIRERIKAGRVKAQTVGARPAKHVKVDVKPVEPQTVVDATLEEDDQ